MDVVLLGLNVGRSSLVPRFMHWCSSTPLLNILGHLRRLLTHVLAEYYDGARPGSRRIQVFPAAVSALLTADAGWCSFGRPTPLQGGLVRLSWERGRKENFG